VVDIRDAGRLVKEVGTALLHGLIFSISAELSLTITRERSRRLSKFIVRRQSKPEMLFEWPERHPRLIVIIQNYERITSIAPAESL
jgi:hypothetical protein